MSGRGVWASRWLTVLVVTWAAGACRIDDSLDSRLWPCSATTRENDCGTRDGRPMTCWEGFCMPTCDPSMPVSKPGQRCLAPSGATEGVLLDACNPFADDCPSTLNCLRTDLGVYNAGLCVPMVVCDDDSDCPGKVKTKCGGEVLREMLGADAEGVYRNHLLCVEDGCDVDRCADPEQQCLSDHYSLYGKMPAICLEKCDSSQQCPPDFACAQADAPGAPLMCLPGLPGVRCTRDDDCLVGSCVDTGAGFSVCTIECTNDGECAAFDHGIYFRCVAGTPGEKKHCIAATPFHGSDCTSDGECPPETPFCSHDSPYEQSSTKSECRLPCDDNETCPSRGGLAHTCLGPEGGCFPGDFGMPCADSSQCLEPFGCEEITEQVGRDVVKQNGSDASSAPLKICTLVCHDELDELCQQNPAIHGAGYCAPDDRCHVQGPVDSPCDRNEECASMNCEHDTCTAQAP